MAVHKLVLDNRIHRTLRISTDATEFNLVPASPYKVLLKIVGGKDTLIISKEGATIATLTCTNTFTPPACGTPIGSVKNPACQFQLNIDDTLYRIVELQQYLTDPAGDKVWITASANTINTADITSTLVYQTGTTVIPMVDGGLKVPPNLG